jgi:ribosomal protein S18 acetylase RimI-like enzyme
MTEEIDGDLESLTINPRTYAPLRHFSCGKGDARGELEVNRMVREYRSGRRKDSVIRATVEAPGHRFVGLAGFHPQPGRFGNPGMQVYDGFAYVSVIGLSETYRGKRKDGSNLGDFLLVDALRAIHHWWSTHERSDEMPWVFSLVDPNNGPSRDLFERHGFVEVPGMQAETPEADSFFRRRKNVDP